MCDIAYAVLAERAERIATAMAPQYEHPAAYIDQAMAAFDAGLEFDPNEDPEAAAEHRARELLEA